MKIQKILVAALLLMTLNLVVLGGVKFVKTWKNPDAQTVSWKGKKVAVFVNTIMTENRKGTEQALAQELTRRGALGVPGSTVVSPEAEKDREAAKRILADAGFIGAVIMQVVQVKPDMYATSGQAYIADPNYTTFSGYWNYSSNVALVPGSVGMKMTVMVETLVYSIEQDKLLWAGTSKTTDAKEAGNVIMKLVDAIGKELKKAGLVRR
jgi:hypothetical protein